MSAHGRRREKEGEKKKNKPMKKQSRADVDLVCYRGDAEGQGTMRDLQPAWSQGRGAPSEC